MRPDPVSPDPADPFRTADLRGRVLAAWQASPARFREDANAEEDFALGGYRDRLVVELAQNAADAAARAGVPGRLLLALRDGVLVAANDGAALDAEAVEALSTLRASAKRDDDLTATVGRFGVGFAAVLAVSDEPAISSGPAGVGWSRARTRELVAAVPELSQELDRRVGHVPVLRLPFAVMRTPEPGYDTAVWLPLRDEAAKALVERVLAEVDAGLLLMLPALAEIVVELVGARSRVLLAADLDVRVVQTSGPIDPVLLADRPTEERRAHDWSVRWAVPRPPGVPAVVHAPTPTDEPLDLPALLIASFPLDPTRRQVAPGPLRDLVVEQAAAAYAQLVREVASEATSADDVLRLVPGPAMKGALDSELRRAITFALADAPFLPGGQRPADAVFVEGLPEAAYVLVADAVPGLLPPAWGRVEVERLGGRRMRMADLVDELAALARPATWWRTLYDALESVDRDALAGLPVLLHDGRLVRGVRGVVVGAPTDLAAALATLGVRVADPGLAHPLLERLGAVPADPFALLSDETVRATAEQSIDADDPEPIAVAVLTLVAAAGAPEEAARWLAELALPDDEGEWAPAGELLLPGSPLADILEPDALAFVDAAWVSRWGAETLAAVGALRTFAVVRDDDVLLDPDVCDHDLDAEDEWVEAMLDELPEGDHPPVLGAFVALRDLDLVADDRWPEALRLIARDPVLRAAVVEPVGVDGVDLSPYTAWWLRTHPVLGGRLPTELSLPGASTELTLLRPAAPDLGLDRVFVEAIGVVGNVAEAGEVFWVPLLAAGVDPRGARPDGPGTVAEVPDVVGRVLVDAPLTYVRHDVLTVAGVTCEWWVDGDEEEVHAATLDGLARGLAWVADRWSERMLVAQVLAAPERVEGLLAEYAWEAER